MSQHSTTDSRKDFLIYIVDDETLLLDMAEFALQPHGYALRRFQDPEAALDAFQQEPTKPASGSSAADAPGPGPLGSSAWMISCEQDATAGIFSFKAKFACALASACALMSRSVTELAPPRAA